jgi:hypothetical protein
MLAILHSLGMFVADLFKPRCRLEAENLFLRHQLSIALRRAPPRLRLRGVDRALLVWMTRLWPSLLGAAQVVQPETILRWHRAGFTAFWRRKSRKRVGRPKIDRGLRDLIQRISKENPQWGASRIHGELLMLGFEVAQSTVSKYMVRGGTPPSQSWKTFLLNHAQAADGGPSKQVSDAIGPLRSVLVGSTERAMETPGVDTQTPADPAARREVPETRGDAAKRRSEPVETLSDAARRPAPRRLAARNAATSIPIVFMAGTSELPCGQRLIEGCLN